jgi:hypothetical protein
MLLMLPLLGWTQTCFKNTNNERCVELYRVDDELGEFIVYLVENIEDPLSSNDTIILKKWSSMDQPKQSYCVQRWTMTGKRIESERTPCTYMLLKNQPFKQ